MPFSFLVICLFVAVLGLPCCAWALSGCSEWRVVPGCARPAHALAPLEEHRLWAPGLRQLQRPRLSCPAASGSDPCPVHWLADS